jgi:hypothetical protein
MEKVQLSPFSKYCYKARATSIFEYRFEGCDRGDEGDEMTPGLVNEPVRDGGSRGEERH